MSIRGVRGATTVSQDDEQEVLSAARELLLAILRANPTLQPEDIASILFTVTDDIHAAYPARAARELGDEWHDVPLMCAREIEVEEGLPRCIRVLLHWNTSLSQRGIQHVYLHDAIVLRPDLANRAMQ